LYFPHYPEGVIFDMQSTYMEVPLSKEFLQNLEFHEMHLYEKTYPIAKIDNKNEFNVRIKTIGNQTKLEMSKIPPSQEDFFSYFEENRQMDSGYRAVGSFDLDTLREFFEQKGFESKIVSGTVVVGDKVIISKDNEKSDIKIQGVFSLEFIQIRNFLYEFTCALL